MQVQNKTCNSVTNLRFLHGFKEYVTNCLMCITHCEMLSHAQERVLLRKVVTLTYLKVSSKREKNAVRFYTVSIFKKKSIFFK